MFKLLVGFFLDILQNSSKSLTRTKTITHCVRSDAVNRARLVGVMYMDRLCDEQ